MLFIKFRCVAAYIVVNAMLVPEINENILAAHPKEERLSIVFHLRNVSGKESTCI